MNPPLIPNIDIESNHSNEYHRNIELKTLIWYFFIQVLPQIRANYESVIF